jgi:deazaflavin-dependent oxidoreductase (nitroreductase family)
VVNPVRFLNSVVMALYRASGGRIANHMQKAPIMLLTTVGSKSGKSRTNPVLYIDDGPNLVTVASAGGAEKNPSWFVNLMRHPDATVTIGREKRRVRGRKASPEERKRLWPMMTAVYSTYGDYAKKTDREIPVVILEPTA